MQARPWTWGASQVDAVVLTVALLCTKSFNYEKLMVREIQRQRGIPLEQIGKIDIIHGKLDRRRHRRPGRWSTSRSATSTARR